MKKPFPTVILFFVLMFLPPPTDKPDQLMQAGQLFKKGQYKQVERIYQQIVSDSPSAEDAFVASRRLHCLYLAMDEPEQAQADFSKMLADFAAHERLPHDICEIGEMCSGPEKTTKARNSVNTSLISNLTQPGLYACK